MWFNTGWSYVLVHYDVWTSWVSFWTVLALYKLAMWPCRGWGHVYSLCLLECAAYTAAVLLVTVSGTNNMQLRVQACRISSR